MTLATKTLLYHIEAEEEILLGLWTQFATLKAFEQELQKRIGTRNFIIANLVTWGRDDREARSAHHPARIVGGCAILDVAARDPARYSTLVHRPRSWFHRSAVSDYFFEWDPEKAASNVESTALPSRRLATSSKIRAS